MNGMSCYSLVGEYEVYVSFSKTKLIEKFVSEAVVPYYERHTDDLENNSQNLDNDTITEIRKAIKNEYYDIHNIDINSLLNEFDNWELRESTFVQ